MAGFKLQPVQIVLLIVLGATLVVGLPLWLRDGDGSDLQVPVPWEIENHPDGSRSVIGIHLGRDSLNQMAQRFGTPDQLALFVQPDRQRSLEAYFPRIGQRGMTARLIATLDAPPALLETLPERALRRESSSEGDARFHFDASQPGELGELPVAALTYIPDYRGLDEDFLRQRFGEPADIRPAGERSRQWFYPDRGMSILIDPQGLDIFQYGSEPGAGSPPPQANTAASAAQDGPAAASDD